MPDKRGPQGASIQWLIKTESERQIGPYSTEAVLKMISEGALTGGEKIKRYPDGKWTAISKQADFYDKLLEALQEVPSLNNSNPDKFEAQTVIAPRSQEVPQDEDIDKTVVIPRPGLRPRRADVIPQSLESPSNPTISRPTIEMAPVNKVERKEKIRSAKLPVFLATAALILGMIGYLWPEKNSANSKPRLLVPRAGTQAALSADQVRLGIQKAVTEMLKDSFEGNIEAQSQLVTVIEGAPQNIDSRGTLCLVYKELWPYVKQDSQDLAAVFSMAKATRSLDPTGINGIYCEVVKLMTLGKYKEARGVVEFALNQPQMSTAPVLYQMKSELLFEERDLKTAILYIEKAKQLWPDWVKPHYDHARYLARSEQNAAAAQAFQETLRLNPKHKLAKIDYGILMFKTFKQVDEALANLTAALASPGKILRSDQSRAHFFLSLIFSERKDLAKAREHAQHAFKLNPGDPQIKDLVKRLGVSTDGARGQNENNELVFLGDQHQRTGNCLAAQAEYKAAFELDSTNATAALKAAKCLWQLNQGGESVAWLQKAIQADAKLTTAYVLLADYQSARHDYVNATQTLNKASKLFPNNYEVLRGYGLIEFRRNNIKDAIAYLQRAYKIYENDVETLILLARSQTIAGDFPAAQKFSVRAIELDSTNTEAQIVYARVLTQFQGLETGLLYLRDLIMKFSYTIDYRLALADLYREQERPVQAQKIYEQIVDAEPKNKKARLGLGESYQAQGFFDKALKQYLAASVADPSDAEGLAKAGLLYIETRKYADAVTQFQRAQAINPLFPRLNFYIGRAFFLNDQFDQSLNAAMAERKINPNLADSYILAAEIYASTKQFQKCATEYQQAIKLRPQGADLYVKLARCYRQSGSPDIAESMLNIAANQESGFAEIYREQGAVYETKGDFRAAVEAYNKYLALSPNAPDRKEIEVRINSIGQ